MTDARQIDAQASEWAIRLHWANLTAAEREELNRWLEADVRHGGALLRAQAAWDDLDRQVALAAGTSLGGDLPLARAGGLDRTKSPSQRAWASAWRGAQFRFAAAATVVIAAGYFAYVQVKGESYSTPLGRTDSVQLADGSRVTLNTDTRIHVQLEDDERRIDLDRGEALFKVAKDPARPFVVHTGTISVRAVGTTFVVRRAGHRTEVMVTEGVVELADRSISAPPLVRRIAANERATIVDTRDVDVEKLSAEVSRNQLAWVDGLVKFTGEPLAAAVAEINRHNRLRIVIDDPALAPRPVVGSFRVTDPANFAATVAVALGAQHVDEGGTIHLRLSDEP